MGYYLHYPITVQTMFGSKDISAWVSSDNAVFAYHTRVRRDGREDLMYHVTHLPTGRAFKEEFATPEQCQCFIELVTPLCNWQLMTTPQLGHHAIRRMRLKIDHCYYRVQMGEMARQIEAGK